MPNPKSHLPTVPQTLRSLQHSSAQRNKEQSNKSAGQNFLPSFELPGFPGSTEDTTTRLGEIAGERGREWITAETDAFRWLGLSNKWASPLTCGFHCGTYVGTLDLER